MNPGLHHLGLYGFHHRESVREGRAKRFVHPIREINFSEADFQIRYLLIPVGRVIKAFASAAGVIYILTSDDVEDQSAILRGMREHSDLIQSPGQRHRSVTADETVCGPQTCHAAV